MARVTLTPRQAAVWTFIRDYLAANGRPPAVRDIAEHFGIRSPNGAEAHIRAMLRKGVLSREPGRVRTLMTIGRQTQPFVIELPETNGKSRGLRVPYHGEVR